MEIVVSLEARYPTDEEEQGETSGWTAFDHLPSPGIWVALATFIPTFLAVVIGVPHVLTSALAPLTTEPEVPVAPRSATMALTASATPTAWAADLRPVVLATSVPSGTEGRGRPTTLVDDAPTPQPSLETTARIRRGADALRRLLCFVCQTWAECLYELVINLKTAKALGRTIPQSLLLRADQVIQ